MLSRIFTVYYLPLIVAASWFAVSVILFIHSKKSEKKRRVMLALLIASGIASVAAMVALESYYFELLGAVIFLLPLFASAVWFAVSVILFRRGKDDENKRRPRRVLMIVSGIIFGVIAAATAFLTLMFTLVVAYM